MAVSLRVTGAWAELVADGAVAIPATPQAGDRMYLFARWKDFSVTAQVTSPVAWTEIAEFADGAVTSGNGVGSVKVGCWYRDWQSGDTNPTLDFSASPDNASVVIMVMQKGVDDVWSTPIAVTAAMTNWTTTSQIVSASSTAVVPNNSVVMGLIGIRDDTATMTRPTSGIDDSSAAIAWDGNYVESPATHHSTTTGFDGAADLGYRLVTTGATATLRMTGTISAAETGSALWVVQGVTTIVAVTPDPASFTFTTSTPSLSRGVTPSPAAFEVTTLAPTIARGATPHYANYLVTLFTPSLVIPTSPWLIEPVAFWDMRFQGSTIIDPWGGHNLTDAINPTYPDMDLAAGKIGHAVTLDPVSGYYLRGANGLTVADRDNFSLWFWIRRALGQEGTNAAQLLHIVNNTGRELSITWNSADDLNIAGGDDTTEATIAVPSDGDWHLVIIQYDIDNGVYVYLNNVEALAEGTITAPTAGANTRWTWGNTDANDSNYDGGPIDIDAAGFRGGFFGPSEQSEIWNSGNGREYVPGDFALLARQNLASSSTTNVSDDMGGTPPASYELQSETEAGTTALVTTTISSSTAEGESPQQQVIIESQGGDSLGVVILDPGIEVSAKVEVTGDDANVELRRVDE